MNSGGLVVDGEFGGSEAGIRDNADGLDSRAGGMYRFHKSSAGHQRYLPLLHLHPRPSSCLDSI